MSSNRTTCGEAGGVSRWGKPCRSVWIDRDSHLCRAHDPAQHQKRIADSSKGGRKSRSNRLSRRMRQLVAMLFSDREAAPTIDRIEPKEIDPSNYVHVLTIDGTKAVLDGPGPNGFHCANHYRCLDNGLFARALRLLRICEGRVDSEGKPTYVHADTGTIIPQSEIAKVERLVKEKR